MKAEEGKGVADPALLAGRIDSGEPVKPTLERREDAGQLKGPLDDAGDVSV
jgi:hypothetical protein